MIKRLAYIVLLLIFATGLSSAKARMSHHAFVKGNAVPFDRYVFIQKDTIRKQPPEDDPKKIKEISKAKKQAKPAKIGDTDAVTDPQVNPKPRKRRPEGLDRPPEIPRRNGN